MSRNSSSRECGNQKPDNLLWRNGILWEQYGNPKNLKKGILQL